MPSSDLAATHATLPVVVEQADPPPSWETAYVANGVTEGMWKNLEDAPLHFDRDGTTELPGVGRRRETIAFLARHARMLFAAHRPVRLSRRARYRATCAGCPPGTLFNDCAHAAWVRSWSVAENRLQFAEILRLYAQAPKAVRENIANRPPRVTTMLEYKSPIPQPMGVAELYVDLDGRAQGPQVGWPLPATSPNQKVAWLRDRAAVATAIREITAEHQPIGATVTDHRLLQPLEKSRDLLCFGCCRHLFGEGFYDRCQAQEWAYGWRAAPSWLWDCIGRPAQQWPQQAIKALRETVDRRREADALLTSRIRCHPHSRWRGHR